MADGSTPTKAEIKAPDRLAPGLYFGLSDEVYHADPALGSGSVRALAKCPIFYWLESWMNPLRQQRLETPALLFGRALHKLVLEGREAFEASYIREIVPGDIPGVLDKADDFKAALRACGGKVSGVKDDLKARIRELDPGAKIWDDEFEAFNRRCIADGKTKLHADVYERVVQGASLIAGDERVRAAFQGGRAEVSVFWEIDGVPMKARFDYLRLGKIGPRTIALITDLKSYANVMDMAPERAVIQAIAKTRLDIQAASYLRGAALIPSFLKEGKVYGSEGINREWLDTLAAMQPEDWSFHWVFYEKDAPISLIRSTKVGSPMIEAANMDLKRAIESYRENMAVFGTNWRFVDPIPEPEIDQNDLPKFMMYGA